MVIKFYVSSISGNKEIKKRQMKAQLIMESKGVDFEVIDISDPGCEPDRRFMQANAKPRDNARYAVAPQFFNEDDYCGDYEGFDEANETDTLEEFLKLPRGSLPQVPIKHHDMSGFCSRDISMEKEIIKAAPAQLTQSRVNGTEERDGHADDKMDAEEDGEEEEEEEDKAEEEVEEQELEAEEVRANHEQALPGSGDSERMGIATDSAIKEENSNQQIGSHQPGQANDNNEEEEDEEEEEEDEEEEEEETVDDILKADDGIMEMSTTVATTERFTEFSYKQLPGEAEP